MLRRRHFELREITGALRAVAEIPPDQQPAHAQPPQQHILDEPRRRERGQPRVEPDHVDPVHARLRDQFQFLAQAREPRRRGSGREEFARVRLEGQYTGRQLALARLGDQPLEHGAMAPVHAIEVADGEPHGAAPRLYDPVRDLHKRV